MVVAISHEYLDRLESGEFLLDSDLILKLLKRTSRSLFHEIRVYTFYGDIQVALNKQSKSNETVKALHRPFQLIPETLHPNKVYQWR